MGNENDKFLDAIRRWEDRVLAVFKLLALIVVSAALLVLKFDDIDKAMRLKADTTPAMLGQTCTYHSPETPKVPAKSKKRSSATAHNHNKPN